MKSLFEKYDMQVNLLRVLIKENDRKNEKTRNLKQSRMNSWFRIYCYVCKFNVFWPGDSHLSSNGHFVSKIILIIHPLFLFKINL